VHGRGSRCPRPLDQIPFVSVDGSLEIQETWTVASAGDANVVAYDTGCALPTLLGRVGGTYAGGGDCALATWGISLESDALTRLASRVDTSSPVELLPSGPEELDRACDLPLRLP